MDSPPTAVSTMRNTTRTVSQIFPTNVEWLWISSRSRVRKLQLIVVGQRITARHNLHPHSLSWADRRDDSLSMSHAKIPTSQFHIVKWNDSFPEKRTRLIGMTCHIWGVTFLLRAQRMYISGIFFPQEMWEKQAGAHNHTGGGGADSTLIITPSTAHHCGDTWGLRLEVTVSAVGKCHRCLLGFSLLSYWARTHQAPVTSSQERRWGDEKISVKVKGKLLKRKRGRMIMSSASIC